MTKSRRLSNTKYASANDGEIRETEKKETDLEQDTTKHNSKVIPFRARLYSRLWLMQGSVRIATNHQGAMLTARIQQ